MDGQRGCRIYSYYPLASWAEPKARPKKIFGGLFSYRVLENISIFESIFGNQNSKGYFIGF